MFKRFKKQVPTLKLWAPVKGQFKALSEVPDPVFRQGMLGVGFAYLPADSQVVAPVSGIVKTVFPTQHAIIIQTLEGLDVLVHIGVDTVDLKGEGIKALVTEGETIEASAPIAQIDLEYILAKGKATDVMVVLPDVTFSEPPQFSETSSGLVSEINLATVVRT